jgi:hypothetical protein
MDDREWKEVLRKECLFTQLDVLENLGIRLVTIPGIIEDRTF